MDLLNIGIVVGTKQLSDEAKSGLYNLPVRTVFEQSIVGDWAGFIEKLDQTRPDVLLVELNQLADPLDDVIRQIKSTAGNPRVIVVHPMAEPDSLLKAIRANADEFVFPPLQHDLARAIRRIADDRVKHRAGTKPRGKVFGVLSAKGGCGATAIACQLARELARHSPLEVLLADFDIELGLIGFLMQSQCRYSVVDAVDNIHRLDISFWKAIVSNGTPGLEVIMAPPHAGVQRERRTEDFRHILRFVRSYYDWSVVDLGRGLSQRTMPLIEEVDEAFLVTTLDIPALHQAKHIVGTLLSLGYDQQRLRLFLNQMPRRSDITVSELEKMLGVPVYATLPQDRDSLDEAHADRKLADPDSPFGRSITEIASRIAGLPMKKSKSKFFFF